MNQRIPPNKFRINAMALIVIAVLIALAAIFVLKVDVGQVVSFGLIAVIFFVKFGNPLWRSSLKDHLDQPDPSNPPGSLSPVLVNNRDSHNRQHGCH